MRTAKQVAEIFLSMEADSKVWVTWLDKEEILEKVQEQLDNADEPDESLTAEAIVTDSFIESVFDSVNNDDYLWERFTETFSESVYEITSKSLAEITEDKELWDTETEKQNAGA